MCVTSAGYLTRIPDILIPIAARVTDRWKRRRVADVKFFSLEQIICPGAQRGHGSTLWCDSFTIWRYLCCFPVGIWCQLYQDDARSGHLEVSLMDLIRGSLKISRSFENERQLMTHVNLIHNEFIGGCSGLQISGISSCKTQRKA